MAVAYLHEFPGATQEHAQRLADKLQEQDSIPPAGNLFHSEGPMDGGWWTFDVWESEESAHEFYDGQLAPIVSEMGMTSPSPRMFDVHWHSNQPQGQ